MWLGYAPVFELAHGARLEPGRALAVAYLRCETPLGGATTCATADAPADLAATPAWRWLAATFTFRPGDSAATAVEAAIRAHDFSQLAGDRVFAIDNHAHQAIGGCKIPGGGCPPNPGYDMRSLVLVVGGARVPVMLDTNQLAALGELLGARVDLLQLAWTTVPGWSPVLHGSPASDEKTRALFRQLAAEAMSPDPDVALAARFDRVMAACYLHDDAAFAEVYPALADALAQRSPPAWLATFLAQQQPKLEELAARRVQLAGPAGLTGYLP